MLSLFKKTKIINIGNYELTIHKDRFNFMVHNKKENMLVADLDTAIIAIDLSKDTVDINYKYDEEINTQSMKSETEESK